MQDILFERARYWSQLAPHPLLQHTTPGTGAGELLVQAALGVAGLSYLLDHKVGDACDNVLRNAGMIQS